MNRDRPLRTGFGIIPNRLWTLPDLSPNQRCLLGWLHSHADDYLSRLTLTRIGREYGGGKRAADHIRRLQETGWLSLIEADNGHPARVILLSDPWEALLVTGHETEPVPVTKRDRDRLRNVTAENNTPSAISEKDTHVGDQPASEAGRIAFDVFWEQYPRKEGKTTAHGRWGKMSDRHRQDAVDALAVWRPYWATIEARFVPHASTWLNQRRWEDDPPDTPDQTPTPAPKPVGCEACDGTAWIEVVDLSRRSGTGMVRCPDCSTVTT